jgi:hypothetical protein
MDPGSESDQTAGFTHQRPRIADTHGFNQRKAETMRRAPGRRTRPSMHKHRRLDQGSVSWEPRDRYIVKATARPGLRLARVTPLTRTELLPGVRFCRRQESIYRHQKHQPPQPLKCGTGV